MKIEVGKEYKTRHGKTRLVVYKSQVDKDFQFLAINKENDDESWYTEDGRYYIEVESGHDLVSPAPKKIKVEVWVNVYPDGYFNTYDSKDDAEAYGQSTRIACKRIEFEVEEGEGL